ncbi:MAG TPA: CPBP family intramembrane metalloprotease [Bacteroidia bacterium]|nr:CPBP family intramembrane metalloprotease [Bacteroidia bacterium]
MIKSNENLKTTGLRLALFFAIAYIVSNIFRFNVFQLNDALEKNTTWFYLILEGLLEGSGIFIAGFVGLHLLRKQKASEISFFGSSKLKSTAMMLVPTVLLIVLGVQNKYGINPHLFGFIAAFGTLLYCMMEEYGWRGYLQSELQFLQPVFRFFLIGCIWYAWHLSFLTDTNVLNNLFFLGALIFGSWGIGKVAELTNSIAACACFHFLVNVFMFNHFFNNAFSGNSKTILLFVSVLLWVLILIKWKKDTRQKFME